MAIEKDKVDALNKIQKCVFLHPYTCMSFDGCQRSPDNDWGELVATEEEWVCPCGKYKQSYSGEENTIEERLEWIENFSDHPLFKNFEEEE